MSDTKANFGMIGMAVMGRSLALNMADHGFEVAVWSRDPGSVAAAVAESEGRLISTASLEALVSLLERPRRIMLMIKAGDPTDTVLGLLRPLLDEGDIVIEGGNSFFEDTRRRESDYSAAGLRFFGVGVSGGEEGARFGPSLMPGGDGEAYERIRPVLEAVAATTDSGPCVTHVGPDGAGHFVKTVHNGIEYADMQFIAEAYHVLRDVAGLTPPELARVFSDWNDGPLESFLVEITGKILGVRDPETDGWLVDQVLDKAGQKGTGRWTAQVALELGVPVPSIAAAIDARLLSSMKEERQAASGELGGPRLWLDPDERDTAVHDALLAAKIAAYAQGMALIRTASDHYGWGVDLEEMARIWKGGCIIRARLLDSIMQAYEADPELANLMLAPALSGLLDRAQEPWREVVSLALRAGIPVPGLASSLAYYDSYRSADLPQNLTQAQRDAFGAHTYLRADDPDRGPIHSDWLE